MITDSSGWNYNTLGANSNISQLQVNFKLLSRNSSFTSFDIYLLFSKKHCIYFGILILPENTSVIFIC